MITMVIAQLDSDQNETASYEFHNVFPSEVSEIQVSADQNDQVQEFDITFTFTDFIVGRNSEDNDLPSMYDPSTLNIVASNN